MTKEHIPSNEWVAMPVDARLQRLLGMTLDDCHDILAMPADYRNAIALNAKIQVIRAVLATCVKLGLKNRELEGARDKMLADLTAKMRNGKDVDPLDEPVT